MIDAWKERLIGAIDERIKRDNSSDRELSLKADMGANFVGQLRQGGRIPRVETLRKIGAYLGISLHYILFGQEITAEEEELLGLVRSLGEADKRLYLAALRGMNHRAASEGRTASAQHPASETPPE